MNAHEGTPNIQLHEPAPFTQGGGRYNVATPIRITFVSDEAPSVINMMNDVSQENPVNQVDIIDLGAEAAPEETGQDECGEILSEIGPENGWEGVELEPVAVELQDPGGASEIVTKSAKKIVEELQIITTKS